MSVAAYRAWCDAQPDTGGSRGVRAIVEGALAATPKKAWVFVGRRERGAAILRGADPARVAEARPYKVVPAGAAPAARALQAVGVALAGEPAVCFLGAGSLSYGEAQEALQLAAAHRAPVIFVVAWYTNVGPFAPQLAVAPESLAGALGLATARCAGDDAAAVESAVRSVGQGPALVVAELQGKG